MQPMMGIFDFMKRKLQEKLEHLRAFNSTSSSNYDTALQLATSIAQGLAEVQGGKGFSPASGTLSIMGIYGMVVFVTNFNVLTLFVELGTLGVPTYIHQLKKSKHP